MKIFDEFNFIVKNLQEKSVSWKYGILFLFVAVPIILAIIQYLVVFVIPPQFTISYLRLNITEPAIPTMFISNYIHDPFTFKHLMGNYLGYVVCFVLNFFMYFILIPVFKWRNLLYFKYPDSAFFVTAAVFLIALPFSISGISILFGRMVGNEATWGFSGITWAFTAYFLFLFLVVLNDLMMGNFRCYPVPVPDEASQGQSGISTSGPFQTRVLLLIFFNSFMIIFTIYLVLLDFSDKSINTFGHLAGFTLGFLLSSLVLAAMQTHIKKQRILLAMMCSLLILIPAVIWIFYPY